MVVNMQFNKTHRIYFLDALRGISILYVILYHLLYDVEFIFGKTIGFFHSWGMEAVHFFFLAILIGVSGISTAFSRNIFRRGAILYILGMLITLGTALFMPENLIVFGILSFFGLIMLLYAAAKPFLDRIDWRVQLAVWILLYIIFRNFSQENTLDFLFFKLEIPQALHEIPYLYPVGIVPNGFYSADYFPLIPWGFIFLCGTALSKPILAEKFPAWFYTFKTPVLDFLGRHTLLIYIAHQPLIFGALWLIYSIF